MWFGSPSAPADFDDGSRPRESVWQLSPLPWDEVGLPRECKTTLTVPLHRAQQPQLHQYPVPTQTYPSGTQSYINNLESISVSWRDPPDKPWPHLCPPCAGVGKRRQDSDSSYRSSIPLYSQSTPRRRKQMQDLEHDIPHPVWWCQFSHIPALAVADRKT